MPKRSRGRGVYRGRPTRSKYQYPDTSGRPVFPEIVMENPFPLPNDDMHHLDKVCRLCMVRGGPTMEYIFQNTGPNSIAAQITFVTQLEGVTEDDLKKNLVVHHTGEMEMRREELLPSHVCQQCIFRLTLSQNFKQQCVESDRTLREVYLRRPGGKSNEVTSQSTPKQNNTDTVARETSPVDDNYVLKVEPLSPCSSENDREDIASIPDAPLTDSFKIEIVEHSIAETSVSSHATDNLQTKKTGKRANINKKNAGPPFVCEDCQRTYPTWDQLRRHRVYHAEKRIPCPECDRKFIRRAQLRRHLLWHSGERPFACTECDKRFAAQTTLDVHMRSHTGVKLFKCHLCDKTFGHNSTLTTHIRGHLGERPYQCPSCPQSFTAKSPLNKHIRTHTGFKPHKCPDCPLSFTLAGSLRAHSRTHSGERPYPCPHCDKSFAQPGGLKNHVRIHTGSKPYECKICYKAYRQQGAYSIHMRTHANIRPYSCDICSRSFNVKKTLARHIRVHTGERQFECSVCQQMFAREDGLATHMLIHSDQRPYQCVTCNKGFRQKMALVLHMRCHTGERPYKCIYCEMTFAQKGTMVTHMRVHTGEKPFSCADCNKRFAQLGNLIDHRKRHHPYSEDPKGDEVIQEILNRISKEEGSEERANAQDSEESDIEDPRENFDGDGLSKARHSCQLCSKTFLKLKTLIWHVERFHAYVEEIPQRRKKLKLKRQRTRKDNSIPVQTSTINENDINAEIKPIKTEVTSESEEITHAVCNETDLQSKTECCTGDTAKVPTDMLVDDTNVVQRECAVASQNNIECNNDRTPTDMLVDDTNVVQGECAVASQNNIECNNDRTPTDMLVDDTNVVQGECAVESQNNIECNNDRTPTDMLVDDTNAVQGECAVESRNNIECNNDRTPTDMLVDDTNAVQGECAVESRNNIECNNDRTLTDMIVEDTYTVQGECAVESQNNVECNSDRTPTDMLVDDTNVVQGECAVASRNNIECNNDRTPTDMLVHDTNAVQGECAVESQYNVECNSDRTPTDMLVEDTNTVQGECAVESQNNVECNSDRTPENSGKTVEMPLNLISKESSLHDTSESTCIASVDSPVATSSHVSATPLICGSLSTVVSTNSYQMQSNSHNTSSSNDINSNLQSYGSCVVAKESDVNDSAGIVSGSTTYPIKTCQMLPISDVTKTSSIVEEGIIETDLPTSKIPNSSDCVKENEVALGVSSITECLKNSSGNLKEVGNCASNNDLVSSTIEPTCITDTNGSDVVESVGQVTNDEGFLKTAAGTSAYLQT